MVIPSEVEDRYWIFQVNEHYSFKKSKEERDSGKWLIFDTVSNIDELWKIVHDAILKGKLGPSAKVSTSMPNPNAKDLSMRVICVFTEDYNNEEDVLRIEMELRELGIKNRLVYKLDRDIGKYAHKGHKNLVKRISEEIT